MHHCGGMRMGEASLLALHSGVRRRVVTVSARSPCTLGCVRRAGVWPCPRPRADAAAARAQVLGRMKQLMVDNNTAASHSFLLDDDSSIPFSLDDIAALMEDKARRRRRRALARLPVPPEPGLGRRPKRPGPGRPFTMAATATAAAVRPLAREPACE